MRLKEKIAFTVFGVLIFFISGGIACTYGGTGAVNPVLAVVLGVLVFLTAGTAACTYGNGKIEKRKTNQSTS
jgi:hypothetical protein